MERATLAAPDGHALVAQGRPGHGPAAVDRPHHVVVRHEDVVEEDLVELRLARDHLERAHLHTVGVHVDDHGGDAVVLGDVGVGPDGGEAEAGVVRAAGPHLLAVDQPAALDPGPPGLDPGGVAAGVGLAEELAPDDLLAQGGHDPTGHLVLGRVLNEGEDHPARDHVLGARDPGRPELLLDHELLDGAGVAPPRLGPVRHDVAGLDQGVTLAGRIEAPQPLGEGAHLGAHRLGLGRQVDGARPAYCPGGRGR